MREWGGNRGAWHGLLQLVTALIAHLSPVTILRLSAKKICKLCAA